MPDFVDQTGRRIQLTSHPKRIVSVVPSQTELLYDLGLEEEVIGITKFCVHPERWFRSKTRVSGTKNLDVEKIRELQPDLVIANMEENVKEQIEEIEKFCPVWISDVKDANSALDMIRSVATLTGKEKEGYEMSQRILSSFDNQSKQELIPACYLIWKEPMMTVGGDTFISDMMKCAGYRNVYADHNRYPEVELEELRNSEIKVILLSTEPYPFSEKDVAYFEENLPGNKIMIVDGEMFSWYGSRMLKAAEYFRGLVERVD